MIDPKVEVLQQQGVRFRDVRSAYVRGELQCGSDVEIDINVIFEGSNTLADGVRIGANVILKDCCVGANTAIKPFTMMEGTTVGADTAIGPYARLRPGTIIGERSSIGNFVEIKNSRIGAGARINHHAFVGDADLAESVTIGAGTITCNHDGVGSVPTVIERGVYVGSNCTLIAPLRIGADATIGAGSTITRDVPAGCLTLARSTQTTIESWPGPRRRRESE